MPGASTARIDGPHATNSPALSIEVVRDAGDWSGVGEPKDLALAAASALGAHHAAKGALPASVTLLLSNDEHIRDLNYRFRGTDAPTNVLSFPSPLFAQAPNDQSPEPQSNVAAPGPPSGFGAETSLGDIILAAETITREANEQGKAPAHHFQHLVLHGLLHLFGFDHESEADAVIMEDLEIELLQNLNIRNPYVNGNGDAAN